MVSNDSRLLQLVHFCAFNLWCAFHVWNLVWVRFGKNTFSFQFFKSNEYFPIFKIKFVDFQQSRHLDFNICTALQSATATVPNIFLYCFFGQMASRSYEKMADSLYEFDWHKLPVNLQKHVILMIANTQQPLFYDGFGVVVLNLETFTSVSDSIDK